MRLDSVSVQELSEAIPWFVVANHAGERHSGSEASGQHGHCGGSAAPVILPVHADAPIGHGVRLQLPAVQPLVRIAFANRVGVDALDIVGRDQFLPGFGAFARSEIPALDREATSLGDDVKCWPASEFRGL